MSSVVVFLANGKLHNDFPTLPLLVTRVYSVTTAKQPVTKAVGITEILNFTTTSSVAGPLLVGGIKIEVLEGVDDLLLP